MAAKKKTEVAETEIKVESTETIEAKPKKTTRKSTKKAEVKTEEPVAEKPITEEPKVEAPVEEVVEVIPEVEEEPAVVEEPKVEEKPVKAKKEPKTKKEAVAASPKTVVAVTRLAAMSGPSFFSRKLGTYAEGTKFVITEEANGWGCVATNKWINLNYVKEA